jgi:hypothetical protein
MDYLVNFGDSWAAGHTLENRKQHAYCRLLAKQLDMPLLDFSKGSTSIQHLLIQFQDFVDTRYYPEHRYHAMFLLTSKSRIFLYEDGTNDIMHCSPNSISNFQETGYYQAYTDPLGTFNFNTSLLALQRLCSLYKVNDYYAFGWETVPLWKSINAGKFYSYGEFAITREFYPENTHLSLQELIGNKNPGIWTPEHSGHPTELGHQKIADAFGKMIKLSSTDVH